MIIPLSRFEGFLKQVRRDDLSEEAKVALDAVETFFSRLTRRRLKRGVFRSIVELQAAINRFVDEHNAEPRPFVWTADPDIVLGKVTRGTQALASVH